MSGAGGVVAVVIRADAVDKVVGVEKPPADRGA